MKKYIIYLIFLCNFFKSLCICCIYPVAYDKTNQNIYFLFQHSSISLKLFEYNLNSKSICPALLSTYCPASLTMLPNNIGFSFIDRGRLRIKYFCKRSPKTIRFGEPITEISMIQWKDQNNFYFSGIKHKNFEIFSFNVSQKKLLKLKAKETADCIYPQILENQLFYLERTKSISINNYKIIRSCLLLDDSELILDCNYDLAFLKMVSSSQGFFIKHPSVVDINEKLITFEYYSFYENKENRWEVKKLFDFSIPLKYLFGQKEDRLYESILPFIPKHKNECIYYVDINNDLELSIFTYNIKINKKSCITTHKNNFSPLIINDKLYYGTFCQDYSFQNSHIHCQYIENLCNNCLQLENPPL